MSPRDSARGGESEQDLVELSFPWGGKSKLLLPPSSHAGDVRQLAPADTLKKAFGWGRREKFLVLQEPALVRFPACGLPQLPPGASWREEPVPGVLSGR